MTEFKARYLADYLPPAFAVNNIDLTFELEDTSTKVTSVLSLTRLNDANEPLILSGEHLTLIGLKLNGEQLAESHYQVSDTQLSVNVNETEFELTVITEINPQENTSLEGLFKSGDAFCTQCEAEGFRRITYYFDRPDVMSVFTTTVIADKNKYPFLLSNGNSIDKGQLDNGKHFVKWHDPFPKPCYLFALVAGDFDLLQDSYTTVSGRDVQLEIFVDRGNLDKAQHAMQALKDSMKWDEETFGLEYDLDIYMIVAVDFFNMGAMENKGLNVFNSKYVLADKHSATDTDYFNIQAVIAHEYFHNWTGNRVTCRDWFQLSLKEGLTVFRDQQFSADMHSAAVTRIQNVRVLRSLQFAEDAGPMAHPIRPEKVVEMNNFYTLTVYEKGSEVIRMMHTLLGKDKFRLGMDLYFKRFDGMAVTCDDFVEAMSDASNIDLSQFKLWYSQAGTPLLTVKESFDAQSNTFTLTIKQSLKCDKNTTEQAMHIPVKIELIDGDKVQPHLLELTELEQSWQFNGFNTAPVVAFLGDFSAPVKVDFPQSDQALATIMVKANNEFCRWDAGQKLFNTYIKQLVVSPDSTLPQSLTDAFNNILVADIDPALKAEQLALPSFDELADSIDEVDPIALVNAIKSVKLFLAKGSAALLGQTYQANMAKEYNNSGDAIGKRSLKNACLSYLTLVEENQHLLKQQYQISDNMTDTLAALDCSAANNAEIFDQQMQVFEQQWSDTTLVMDKWFTLAASVSSDDIFERLAKLINHPKFSLQNPNRARSLIGAFASRNPQYFHCQSGKGYQFLTEQIIKLNDINPQVASRLITPLIQYKGFDKTRQALMKAQLEKLSSLANLSKDLKEKLDAALA
ncbi:aminopeptidase N [Thalassotalea sp. PLHSN55]|uniref:aminopeptidase N n=1 Tax=Thalassotalea sp. PLHSN55 TaxID=3435888 RepID=UPI003F8261CD